MKNKSGYWLFCAAFFGLMLMLASVSHALASAVTDGLKTTIDRVINVVTDAKYKGDPQARRAKLRGIIHPKFDYIEMGKRSLARNWRDLSPQERRDFIDLFGQLLENSYAKKIESYQNEEIKYVDEVIKGKYAMVKTEIVRKNDVIGVDYKLIQNGNEWQVYDFIVEGVSLIRNYRSQFNKIIVKESFAELMKKLGKKVKDLEAGTANDKDEI
ncbi:MlaC/ttg2D family ABC transporter substrate-binding protein [Nitrospina watsonii]|uniref:Toluene tolerance family protein n=1 Tax=Nitrospina watsonii TaxID=1323948 RepID=A0ABM9HGK0_9BACT|nr:ABC transporter substrate-binding protein [Nitrospina watsonii]CAI2719154.1 Toluene tolerance family protein [Nitrospina watsonii]